jgi:rare lipoprotein A (peptidoglycan hydrolase)
MLRKVIFFCIAVLFVPSIALGMEATYYADAFEGGGTAYGNIFSQSNHSAAICGLPLGQLVYVSRGETGAVV